MPIDKQMQEELTGLVRYKSIKVDATKTRLFIAPASAGVFESLGLQLHEIVPNGTRARHTAGVAYSFVYYSEFKELVGEDACKKILKDAIIREGVDSAANAADSQPAKEITLAFFQGQGLNGKSNKTSGWGMGGDF